MKLSRMTGIFINWRVREWHFQVGRYWPFVFVSMNPYWREIVEDTKGAAVARYQMKPICLYRTLVFVTENTHELRDRRAIDAKGSRRVDG